MTARITYTKEQFVVQVNLNCSLPALGPASTLLSVQAAAVVPFLKAFARGWNARPDGVSLYSGAPVMPLTIPGSQKLVVK